MNAIALIIAMLTSTPSQPAPRALCQTENGLVLGIMIDQNELVWAYDIAPDEYISMELLMKKGCQNFSTMTAAPKIVGDQVVIQVTCNETPSHSETIPLKCELE